MGALGEHIRSRLRNDGPIATTPERRCLVARTILETGREFDLLSFGLVDTHLHLAKGGVGAGGELARRVEIAMTRRFGLEVGFEKVRVDPVVDIWHLYRVFDYVLRQDRRHKVETDPLREATNLPDLLGLREVGGYTVGNVRRLLPRVTRNQLLELIGVPVLAPADGPVERLVQAAAAAVCEPRLVGHSHDVNAARRAVIAIAEKRLNVSRLAELLGVHRTTISRLRRAPVDATLIDRVRLQLGLLEARWELAVGAQTVGSPPPQRRAA